MSTDEEIQVRGRILSEYLDAKKTLAALDAEADKLSSVLSDVSRALGQKYFAGKEFEKGIAAYPAPEKVKQLVAEIRSMQKKKEDAEKQLRQLGVDFK